MDAVRKLEEWHTNSLWLDAEGDVWFYDQEKGEWAVLSQVYGWVIQPGFVVENGLINELYGPFTLLRAFEGPEDDE